ncbi:helix-turn-helix transcriptional regulator [Faecalicatena sp. Marseille-Q4148]|nr:helix-turn-helix transcriptional regulator [Faecalicatena sp. Marseille-Q4148]
MGNGSGELLYRLRKEADATLEQLGKGLCSLAEIGKIESDQLMPDHFLFDRLFGRLGKSVDRFEFLLPLEVYEIYEERFLIQRELCYGRWKEAWKRLKQFEEKHSSESPLHRQFVLKERAQIVWLSKGKEEKVLELLEAAICETMPPEGAVESRMLLSAEELKLLLFRWEVCLGTCQKRSINELKAILSYRNLEQTDDAEKAKWFPYAALLFGMGCDREKEHNFLELLTKEALSLLRSEGYLLYMPEILEQYAVLLKEINGDEKMIQTLLRERESLLKVEEKYGMDFSGFRLFEHTTRRFQLESELIRKERKAMGISQEELSDGICAPETLARIESGKRRPREKKVKALLEKMKRERKQVNPLITTNDYEVLRLMREFCSALDYSECETAGKILDKIEARLDRSKLQNNQFLCVERVKILYAQKKWTPKECLEELEKQLRLTLDIEKGDVFKHELTIEEHSIVNVIAVIYYENGEREKANRIWELQKKGLENSRLHAVFHILEWELATENLAMGMEEQGEKRIAIEFCREKKQVSIEAGRGNPLGRSLITMASAMEEINQKKCLELYLCGLDLLKLYKMKNRYEEVLSYLSKKEFFQALHCRDQLREALQTEN